MIWVCLNHDSLLLVSDKNIVVAINFNCRYQSYTATANNSYERGCYYKGCQCFHCWEDILMFMFPSTALYFTLVKRMGTHICMVSKYLAFACVSSALVLFFAIKFEDLGLNFIPNLLSAYSIHWRDVQRHWERHAHRSSPPNRNTYIPPLEHAHLSKPTYSAPGECS